VKQSIWLTQISRILPAFPSGLRGNNFDTFYFLKHVSSGFDGGMFRLYSLPPEDNLPHYSLGVKTRGNEEMERRKWELGGRR
jgi:hypothetical protein